MPIYYYKCWHKEGSKYKQIQSEIVNYTPQGFDKTYFIAKRILLQKSFTLGLLTNFLGRLRILWFSKFLDYREE